MPPPLILLSVAKVIKKLLLFVTKARKKVFYNIKKICVKQITQISFNLLFITGVCL